MANKRTRTRWTTWAVPLVLAFAVLVTGCSTASASGDLSSKDTVTAFVGELAATTGANGQVLTLQEAALSFSAPGQVTYVAVDVGDTVHSGDVLAQIESEALEHAVRNAELNLSLQEANLDALYEDASEKEISSAQASVESAQAQLDDLLAGPSDLELAEARASLASAQAQLDDLLAGPSDKELAQAQAALVSAQAAEAVEQARYAALEEQLAVTRMELDLAEIDLESAQYFYDALKNDWQHIEYADHSPEAETLRDAQTAYNVAVARYSLSSANMNDSALLNARSQVDQAQADLDALTEDKTVEVAAAREQLAQAEASLDALTKDQPAQVSAAQVQLIQAENSLADLVEEASTQSLDIARAQVEQARIQLADAQERLDKATLVAPFDGVVTAVYVEVGELASGLVVELIDPHSMEVVLDVDEVDIASIVVGQRTVVTLETWPDRELEGRVTAVAPRAQSNSGTVSYSVHIALAVEDLDVRDGMTANADLVTLEREDVLLVPNEAVTADRDAGEYYVYRLDGEAVEKVEIDVGVRDKSYTEVTSGLDEGDELVVDYVEEELVFGPGQGKEQMQ